MTDRELLELAAKAAKIDFAWKKSPTFFGMKVFTDNDYPFDVKRECAWRPLDRNGDALRLAVQLRIDVVFSTEIHPMHAHHQVTAWYGDNADRVDEFMHDPMAATRRAIVRAAAEIGKSMP